MGHACQILTFKEKMEKAKIQAACDDWGDRNCDVQERGGYGGGLQGYIQFTNRVFDTYDEAEEFLETTWGYYRQTAVKYRVPKRPAKLDTKAIQDLQRRMTEYQNRIQELEKPHYVGTKSKTIKCKKCGAVLPTEYCGKAYINNCPICRSDLRPATTLEKLNSYKATYKELQHKYQTACRKEEKKSLEKGYDLYWAVACEVHC